MITTNPPRLQHLLALSNTTVPTPRFECELVAFEFASFLFKLQFDGKPKTSGSLLLCIYSVILFLKLFSIFCAKLQIILQCYAVAGEILREFKNSATLLLCLFLFLYYPPIYHISLCFIDMMQ